MISANSATPSSTQNLRDLAERRLRLLREARRRACRGSLETFATDALAPLGQTPAAHHRLLIRELEKISSGENDRLMVFMPPGSAKSTYASVLFPPWWFARHPRSNVVGASYGADLAQSFSRRVQNTIREHSATLGYGLATENVERWATTSGGEYKAVGSGASVTGFRADLIIMDDPIRGRADADSAVIRDRIWAWYWADLVTRLKPGGRIVLIQTRWHEDDIAGRLQQIEGDRWRVIKLPALASANDDPLGRSLGEPLWADDGYGYGGELLKLRKDYEISGGMRDWASLYQQEPRPAEGALFKVAMMPHVGALPSGSQAVRAWDLAATAQTGTRDPDWTVGVKLARVGDQFFVLDVVRLRGGPDEVEQAIVNTAAADGRSVKIGLPQDPGQAGKLQVLYLTRKLAGYTVESSPETGDKATRAAPVASQANVGNLSLVEGPWVRPFLAELAGFPSGAKDDQVDALSRAYGMIGMKRPSLVISAEALATARRR